MKKVYVTGIAGTGKSTVLKKLKEKGFCTIGTDETLNLCHWVNQKSGKAVKEETALTEEFVSSHDWLCDIKFLQELIDRKKEDIVFVLGITGNQEQYLDNFDKILCLTARPEVFLERINNRIDNDFGKEKKVQKRLLGWYKEYEDKMSKRGATIINAEKPIDEVVEQILKNF